MLQSKMHQQRMLQTSIQECCKHPHKSAASIHTRMLQRKVFPPRLLQSSCMLLLMSGLGMQVGVKEGVVFLTYSSLTSSSDKGDTRLQQLVDWAGPGFDGLIIFDECHKAKNLVPEAGSKSTKVRPCCPPALKPHPCPDPTPHFPFLKNVNLGWDQQLLLNGGWQFSLVLLVYNPAALAFSKGRTSMACCGATC